MAARLQKKFAASFGERPQNCSEEQMNKLQQLFRRWSKLAGILAAGLLSTQCWCNDFRVEHWRDGQKIADIEVLNGIVDVGVNSLLDVGFRNQSQIATWYMGLVDNSGFSAFAAGDTMASHAGWNLFTTYSDATRITWVPAAAASRSISNSVTSADFNINGSGTVKGVFITSDSTKSGTTGTLWATAAFASTVPVVNGDVLKVTYTISG